MVVDDLELLLAADEDAVRDADLLDGDSGLRTSGDSMWSEQIPLGRSVLTMPHATLSSGCPGVNASFLQGCLLVAPHLLLPGPDGRAADCLAEQIANWRGSDRPFAEMTSVLTASSRR